MERAFFQRFPFLVHRPLGKVISVGNLTVGGTGKTPVLLALLGDSKRSPKTVVLTRGYRSPWERGFYVVQGEGPHPTTLTDETLLVNREFPDIPILVGKNRAHAAKMAQHFFAPECYFLDDGFQYRRLKKDVDLVLWDSTKDPFTARLLPEGRLREPFERLRDASLLLLTRCEQSSEEKRGGIHRFFEKRFPELKRLELETHVSGWVDPEGKMISPDKGPMRCWCFCAIGAPETFFQQVQSLGAYVRGKHVFRDHSHVSRGDLEELARAARTTQSMLVCTEKDLIKLSPETVQNLGIYSLKISVRMRNGADLGSGLRDHGIFLY